MTALTITQEKPLTTSEETEFSVHEFTIAHGISTFIKVGNALAAIRDQRLYRNDYGTFEEYCRERWKISKTHANRMIGAADIAEDLTPIGVIPNSESQLRPLAALPAEQRREAWQMASQESGKEQPTARAIQKAVQTVAKPRASSSLETYQALYEQVGAKLSWLEAHGVYEMVKPNGETVSTPHFQAVRELVWDLQRNQQIERHGKCAQLVHVHSARLAEFGYQVTSTAHGTIWVYKNGNGKTYNEEGFIQLVQSLHQPVTLTVIPADRQQLISDIQTYLTTTKHQPALAQLLTTVLGSL